MSAPFGTSGTDAITRSPREHAGCVLRVIAGPDKGRELDLPSGHAVVGTREPAELLLTDRKVSGAHLSVSVGSDGLHVRDLGSTNGTYYLQTKLSDAVVEAGAVLVLGATQLLLAPRTTAQVVIRHPRARHGRIIGHSQPMQELYERLDKLANAAASPAVLILGETGSGKDVVARAIHADSPRADAPFEVVDCGALPRTLIESELFGHVRGSFTGAERDHIGAFERAHKGTLFIDELGELPLDLQPKLLRALETGEVRPIGGQVKKVDVRLIAATHRDLEVEVRDGRFRSDLFYRVNVVRIDVAPLRERREDIPELVSHFVADLGMGDVKLGTDTLEAFVGAYDWPGNVRELRNAVASSLIVGTLPKPILERVRERAAGVALEPGTSLPYAEARDRFVERFERDYLAEQLEKAGGNASKAARLSGVDRAYFRRLLLRHGLVSRE